MNVSSILKRKGTHVESVRPDHSLAAAAKRLAEHRIGSVAVVDGEGDLVGVFSEAHLARAVAERGADALASPVSAWLDAPVPSCEPSDSLRSVMEKMTSQRVRHLAVRADEAIVGIVSLGDVVKAQLADLELEVGVLRDLRVIQGSAATAG